MKSMFLCVHRFPEHARCHASISTTSSDLQYHAARFPGAPGSYDVCPACRSVTYSQLFLTWAIQLYHCYLCVCVNVWTLLVLIAASQTMGPQTAATAVTSVRGVPQYKYAAGVRNPQQHMTPQQQVTMQQVWMHFLFCKNRGIVTSCQKVYSWGAFRIYCEN